jgi:hypothetical protein
LIAEWISTTTQETKMALDTPQPVGSVTINSNTYPIYGTNARANEYMDGRLGVDDWPATADDQNKALVQARRWLDRQSWCPEPTDPAQTTAWPRTGLTDKEGEPVATTTVPLEVEFAQYELALELAADPTAADTAVVQSNAKRLKAGSAEIENFRISDEEKTVFPAQVMDLVGLWLASSKDVIVGVAGGTETKSSFDGDSATTFNLNESW